MKLTSWNEMDMAIYCPDVFLRVIKAAQHGLVKQICLKKVLIINLERNHFFTMNMLSCGVLLWELETGSWWTLPSFFLMFFWLPSCWAQTTIVGESLGCSPVSHPPASIHLCLFCSSVLRTAFLLLLLVSATWLLGLMAVNSDVMTFHYLFAIFSCLQVRWVASCLWYTLVSTLPHPPKTCSTWANLQKTEISRAIFCFLFSRRKFFSSKL